MCSTTYVATISFGGPHLSVPVVQAPELLVVTTKEHPLDVTVILILGNVLDKPIRIHNNIS